MRPTKAIASIALAALLALPAATAPAAAGGGDRLGADVLWGTGARARSAAALQGWMHPEIAGAWGAGFQGQGTRVVVIDDFRSGATAPGDLGSGQAHQRHGEWVREQVSLLAPRTTAISHDFSAGRGVGLVRGRLNVLNLSYGMMAAAGHNPARIRWARQEATIIAHARNGRAVVVKAAGNAGVAVGAPDSERRVDYLNLALTGAQSAIFVGALDRNGTPQDQAVITSYSNVAGTDPRVQSSFLMVGVRGDLTGLYGTSFAAPVVSGYAAVLGSKFTRATPTQIADQLLRTARTDTIHGYSAQIHGRGEASIARALAPVSIR